MIKKNTIRFAPSNILIVVIVCLLLGCGGETPVSSHPPNPSFINIGIRIDDLPGFAIRRGGDRYGFDIDLAQYISNKLGRDPVFVPVTADQRGQSLKQGKVEMVVSTYSITDERKKFGIVFAGPYMRTFQGVIVKDGNNTINSISDLNNKIVCALKGTTSIANLRKIENVLVTEEDTFDLCIQDIKNKNVDAASTDAILLQTLAHEDHSLKFLPHLRIPASYELYGIGFWKDNGELCHESEKFLKDFVVNTDWNSAYNVNLQPLGVAEKTSEEILPLKPDPQNITLESC
jgi:glutamate transport system substrate-binding protein